MMPNKLTLIPLTLALCLPAINCWAMQAMDDASMAQATGQDGVSIEVGTVDNSGIIGFDRLSLQDGDGFGDYTGPASLGYFTTTSGTGVGFYSGTDGATVISTPLKITLDSQGSGSGSPLLNAHLRLDSSLTRINLSPFTISLTVDAGDHAANPANHGILSRRDLIRVGGEGINISLKSGSALGINMQLGGEPQEHMFEFTGGQINEIKNDPNSPIEILSYTGNTETSSLKLNFSLKANADSSDGIQLKDMYVDLNNNGMTFGKDGLIDKFDLTLSDVIAGSSDAHDTATFNNLKNGSIGSFGVIGASVKDLKMSVKGL